MPEPSYFDTQPNFTNPAYASPEQLAAARAYADALMKRSTEGATRPTGVIAAMLDALTSNIYRNNANQLQSQAAEGNARDTAALVAQMQSGQRLDPQTLGHLYANPMASPEARALVQGLISPQAIKSEYGQPGYTSPSAGVVAPPIRGPYTPGYRGGQGVEGSHQEGVYPAPGAALPPPPRAAVPPPAGTGGVLGGMKSKPAGWDENNVVPAPSATPPAPSAVPIGNAAGGYQGPMTMDQLRNYGLQSQFLKGQATAQTGAMTADYEAANTAPTQKRLYGMMLDDIVSHPELTFGPSADFSNNAKRFIANYAPNMIGDKQIQSLAAADSIDKIKEQLATSAANAGRSDMSLLASSKSVPGAHNSREGAIALAKMGIQLQDQALALRQATAGIRDPSQYEAVRNRFYQQNPIINELTGNPIAQDLDAQRRGGGGGGGARIIGVRPAR